MQIKKRGCNFVLTEIMTQLYKMQYFQVTPKNKQFFTTINAKIKRKIAM